MGRDRNVPDRCLTPDHGPSSGFGLCQVNRIADIYAEVLDACLPGKAINILNRSVIG